MPTSPKITVIIVSWNVHNSLIRCLDSIVQTKYPNLEIIIIDNASTDDSIKLLKSFRSLEIRLIRNLSNLGFPKAVNQGLRISSGEYVLLLNPDTRIPAKFFIDSLAFFKNFPTAGIMGPKLLNTDGSLQGSVFHEPSLIASIREFWLGQRNLTSKYTPNQTHPTIVDSISGACMFFPRTTFKKLGYFTESVFMYYEDMDYCRRIRNQGLNVYFNPNITVIHEHGSSSRQSPLSQKYLWESSMWYNGIIKHYLMWFISWTGQKIYSIRKNY